MKANGSLITRLINPNIVRKKGKKRGKSAKRVKRDMMVPIMIINNHKNFFIPTQQMIFQILKYNSKLYFVTLG